jgi:glycosyltransferase involved in cell wall biosynthesis
LIFFSIITINYNNHFGLERTIQSVVSQSFQSYEYLVIDGGSTDGSKDCIALHDSHINYWVSESDSGVYHAMNKGWKKANGQYCIFLNSGDVFADTEVLKHVYELTDPTSGLVYGCHLWESLDGARWNPKKDFKMRDILTHTPISHQATFIKKSVLEKIGGFREQYKIIADWGVLVESMFLKCRLQKISLDICIAERPGESNIAEKQILLERKRYFMKHHFGYYFCVKFLVLPFIRVKRYVFR